MHFLFLNGYTQPEIAIIHIAGTNGKGSVALKLAKTLQLLGCCNVGLYSSPHVSCFRERIQMNGQFITEQEVADDLPSIYKLCRDHDIPATFFEITTTLAFNFFARRHDEFKRQWQQPRTDLPAVVPKTIVILEAGLGGRLDATNVVRSPVLSIITSIGLDHTKILGDTREEIAIEKAGIMRPDTPVIVGPSVPLETLRQYGRDKGILSLQTSDEVLGRTLSTSSKDGTKDYDTENSNIASAALFVIQKSSLPGLYLPLEIPAATLRKGTRVRPPCRFEVVKAKPDGPTVILDVAHNPPAMESLVAKLQAKYADSSIKFRFLLGISKDKDWKGLLDCLWPLFRSNATPSASKIHLAQAAHGKATPLPELINDILMLAQPSHLRPIHDMLEYNLKDPSVTAQLKCAMKEAVSQREVLVVCGSVFLMVEVRQVLGIEEPRDTEYLIRALVGKTPEAKAFGNNEIHA